MLQKPSHYVNFKQKHILDTHFCVWNLATSEYECHYCTVESFTSTCAFKMRMQDEFLTYILILWITLKIPSYNCWSGRASGSQNNFYKTNGFLFSVAYRNKVQPLHRSSLSIRGFCYISIFVQVTVKCTNYKQRPLFRVRMVEKHAIFLAFEDPLLFCHLANVSSINRRFWPIELKHKDNKNQKSIHAATLIKVVRRYNCNYTLLEILQQR
jgi:hypothetical protein